MTKLVIPQGLPGSGKSTYAYNRAAEDPGMVVVSLDGLREVLKGSRQQYHSAEEALRKEHRGAGGGGLKEGHVTGVEAKSTPQRPKPLTRIVVDTAMTMTRSLLTSGYSVVYDAQNLNPRGVEELRKLAEECNVEVEVVTMPTLSLAELLERNSVRPEDDQVPEEYLVKQYQTYTQTTATELKQGKRGACALKVSSGWLLFDTFEDAQVARKEVRTSNSPVKVTVDDTVNTIGYISGVNVFSETIPHGQRLYAGRSQKQTRNGNTLLESMVNNPNVRVVPVQGEENLFACNFTREAFSKGNWDEYSSMARGLFLDPQGEVVMRGFDKFFNIGENAETTLDKVLQRVEYPVRVESKENGFLGLVGVAKDTTESDYRLRFFSKSGNTDYSKLVKKAWARVFPVTPENLLDAIAKENVTLAFEVIDTENDKHIIPYKENRLVLLHCIANSRTFQITDPESVTRFFPDRPAYKVAQNEQQLLDLLGEAKSSLTSEGCVLYSSNGYMVKVKSDRYLKVKSIRSMVENCVLRGNSLPDKRTPRVEAARRVLAQAKAQERELKYYAPLLDTWKVDLTWVDVSTLGL